MQRARSYIHIRRFQALRSPRLDERGTLIKTFKRVRDTARITTEAFLVGCLPRCGWASIFLIHIGNACVDRDGGRRSMSKTPKAVIMDETAIGRAVTRIAHEILERNEGCENLAKDILHTTDEIEAFMRR